jgi:hypothetical protein
LIDQILFNPDGARQPKLERGFKTGSATSLQKEPPAMCDYSLENVMTRPAKVGDKLVIASFVTSITRGFAAVEDPKVAVCLRPGTEVAFDREVEYDAVLPFFHNRRTGANVARFRQIETDIPGHRDALEFPNGKLVLITKLAKGQVARVLQLPAATRTLEGDFQVFGSLIP